MADAVPGSNAPPSEPENPAPNPNPKSAAAATVGAMFPSLTLSIWPPSQRTRDAVTSRLVDTLTSPDSVLAKRYGVFPRDDALAAAERIEREAFATAEEQAASSPDGANPASSPDAGLEILELYSKTISRKMLESVKARSPSSNTVAPNPAAPNPPAAESLSVDDAESRVSETSNTEGEAPAAA